MSLYKVHINSLACTRMVY